MDLPTSRKALDQISKAAKLSSTAVSRYLNGLRVLLADTGRCRDNAARQLGCRPRHQARSLSRDRSDTTGRMISKIDNFIGSRLAATVRRSLDERGIAARLRSRSSKLSQGLNYTAPGSGVVDGLLFATNTHDAGGGLKMMGGSFPFKGIDGASPPLLGADEGVLKDAEGLEVLATLPAEEKGHPLLATGEFGQGRTLARASDIGPDWLPNSFVECPSTPNAGRMPSAGHPLLISRPPKARQRGGLRSSGLGGNPRQT